MPAPFPLASMVPRSMKSTLRRLHREWVFDRAMRRFLRQRSTAPGLDEPTARALLYGWGNEGWSGLEEFLASSLREASLAEAGILECGSGLSTLLVGAVAQRRGIDYWALEHLPAWHARVQRLLHRYRLTRVRVVLAPLRDYGSFTWYDPPLGDMPSRFGLVLCDGPPAETPGGRYGLFPVMGERLGQGSVVLLDDVEREEERDIAHRWARERGAALRFDGVKKPLARLAL